MVCPPRGSGVVFVTGAGGFIGQHVVSAFQDAGWRVAGFGHKLPDRDNHLDLRSADRWFPGAVARPALSDAVAALGRPEIVIHAAGGSSVGASFADPTGDFERTVGSTREVLDFMRGAAGGARLVFLSSAAVYGSTAREVISEATPTHPISPYGLHKMCAEDLVRGSGIRASIVRFFSVYGPGNRKQLLWDIASRLRDAPRTLELSGSGAEARDFLYVDDAVRMIGLLAGGEGGSPPLVNGGSGFATTVSAAANGLVRALGLKTSIVFSGIDREGDPARLVSDPELARSVGFSPDVPFATGLDRFAAWFKGRESRNA